MTVRHRIPARVTPLVGRADELTELTSLLERERVLTLTGSGGCGKTRLAAELAGRIGHRSRGGVAWVELAPCSDFAGVLSAVTTELGVVESPGEGALDELVGALSGREPTLLVLDNAEHVLGAVAEVVAALSSGVAHVTVVCTSRELVGVPGEVVWRVPSLGTPPHDHSGPPSASEVAQFDSVLLFADRARRVRRGFAVTDENAGAVAQICIRLDGVPLAIELAAARVRTMPPERIAALLDDRFRLLGGGPRTLLARQQTLQASVAWSESLLDDTERAVLRRLGVFVGGFTIDGAEQVVAAFDDVDPYEVPEVVGRLVDKSLVQFDEHDDDRYSLLETIRSYALQRLLEVGELGRARDAHADWCATWLETLVGDDGATDVNSWWESRVAIVGRVDPEWRNCASALEWVVPGSVASLRLVTGLGDYWALRQRANDSARYGMPVLLAADQDAPEWLPAVLALQAVRTNAADPEYARLREDAIRLATRRGDRRALLRLELGSHIAMVMLLGPRDDLLAALDGVRDEATELGEWYTAWNSMQSPAVMLVAAGRPREADERVVGLTSTRAQLIRAAAAQARGELSSSAELAARAESLVDAGVGAFMDRIVATYRTAGEALASADPSVLAPLRLGEMSTDSLPRPFLAAYTVAHGVDDVLHGRLDEARATFAALQPDLFTSWQGLGYLAQVELARDDAEAARSAATGLREAVAEVSAPLYETTSDLVLAECDREADVNGALDLAHRALSTAAGSELRLAAIDALEAIGAMLVDVGRLRDAGRLLAAAQAARGSIGYRHRFPHRARYVAAARDDVVDEEGWAEGAVLDLTAAIELAQRMRGERVRPLAGWESLTPTEVRVVEQVVAGLTNPQIAEQLLMSRATVKTHLGHVYAKLGFTNRAELAAAAARRGLS